MALANHFIISGWTYVCLCAQMISCVQLLATLWTVALQVPLSMGFSRQEYCSGFPFPSPGDLPDPGLNTQLLHILHWQMGSLPLCHLGSPELGIFHPEQNNEPENMLRGVHVFHIHSGNVMRSEILEGEKSNMPLFALDLCTCVW